MSPTMILMYLPGSPEAKPLLMLATCHVEPFPVVWLMNCGARWTSVLFVHVLFSGLYSNEPGAWSLIVMATVAEVEPPELLAQIV